MHAPLRHELVQRGLQRAGASSVQAWRLTQDNPRFLLMHGIPTASSALTAAALELALD